MRSCVPRPAWSRRRWRVTLPRAGCALLWTASEFELLSFSSFAFHLALLLVYVCDVTNRTNNHDRIAYMWKKQSCRGSESMQGLTEILSMPCAAWVGVLWFVECMTFWTIFFCRHQHKALWFSPFLVLVFFVARKFRAVGRVGREVWSVKFKCGVRRRSEVWSVRFGVWRKQWEVWSVKCGLCSVECEVRSEKCEVWSLEWERSSEKWEVWTVDCEVWSVKCEVRSENCEVWSLECVGSSEKWELWNVECEVWSVKCEVRSVDCEV